MRIALLTIALALGAEGLAAPAAAQFLGPHLEAQRYDNLRRHQRRIAKKRALTPHQRRCAARYRSYNPRTDRYTVRPGVTAACRL